MRQYDASTFHQAEQMPACAALVLTVLQVKPPLSISNVCSLSNDERNEQDVSRAVMQTVSLKHEL
jgi:hypothetical protein